MKKAAVATLLSLSLLVTMNLVPLNKTASNTITALKINPAVVDPGH